MKTHKINHEIYGNSVYLIENSESPTLFTFNAAMNIATGKELDLVQVANKDGIALCKLMDYGKFKFEAHKKDVASKKNTPKSVLKEIRVSPRIEQHDIQTKLNQVRKFLDKNFKVQVSVLFKGREASYKEIGLKVLEQFKIDAANITNPKYEGNMISILISRGE